MTEIRPPWIEYPDYPPYDTFWRQSGQLWFKYLWEPYWHNLSAEQQEKYLRRWNVPQMWHDFYFDTTWHDFLETLEDDE